MTIQSLKILGMVSFFVFALGSQAHAEDIATINANLATMELRLISRSLAPTGDPVRQQEIQLVQQAGGAASGYQQAAYYLINNEPDFSRITLRDYFAVMQNLGGTQINVPFNKAILLSIAMTLQGDVRQIFTANQTCLVAPSAGATPVDPESIQDDSAWDSIDLRSAIACTPGQNANDGSGNTIQIPSNEAAGYWTVGGTGSYADTSFTAGTNLREGMLRLQSTLGPTYALPQLESTSYGVAYIGPYVTRNPSGGGYTAFVNQCSICHGLNNGWVPCYHWDSTSNNGMESIVYNPSPSPTGNKCWGSNPGAVPAGSPGYIRSDSSWVSLFNPQQQQLLGINTPNASGVGYNAFGQYWASIGQVYVYFIERIANGNTGVCIGGSYTSDKISAEASKLQQTGDLITAFADVASDPSCLGE